MNINLTLIAQAIAFAIFIWFTVRFVWPPLVRAIEDRQSKIAEGLAAGEAGKQNLASSEKRVAEMLTEARSAAANIISQGERIRTDTVSQAKREAEAEAARVVAAAKAEIAQELSRAKEALRAQVADLAVAGAEKILRREVDAKAHAELLASIQREL